MKKAKWPFDPAQQDGWTMDYDLKNRYDRVGDWIFAYHMRNMAVLLLSCLIVLLAFIICHQFQDYLQSFHRTVAEARTQFTRIEKVPSWTISFNYNN